MKIEFNEVPFVELRSAVIRNLQSYPSPIDSYYEDHVMESKHYQIDCDEQPAGYASIHSDSLLTQFVLDDALKPHANEIFSFLLQQRSVREAYVSTSDGFFLSCSLDQLQSVLVQDWVFHAPQELAQTDSGFSLTKASIEDQELIRRTDEGFFQNLPENLQRGEIFLGKMDDQLVSYGIIEKSKLLIDQASLGMFVIKECRGKHYGSNTIRALIGVCRSQRIIPVAGCFARNEFSRNALSRAGMFSDTRLLKIKFSNPL
jgi:hypothetical protein